MSVTIELLQRLIRNACVNDGTRAAGREVRSAETLEDFFGVTGERFEPAPGRRSLVYRVKGTDPAAPSLTLAPHLDVVPADASGWSLDPFAAEIVDGFVYGRGAVDMLNVTAAMAVAFKPYLTGERTPNGDLIFCALADEEAGGELGAAPLVQDHWDLVGCDYLLTEVAYPGLPGDLPGVPVTVGEKGAYWSHLSATGTPGHGSAPYGTDNAIAKLTGGIAGIVESESPAAITPEWLDFVDSLGLDAQLTDRLRDLDTLDEAIDELAATDPTLARYVHAATHLTISPNVIRGGTKSNVIPDAAKAEVDIRSLPGMDRPFVESHLRKAMGSVSDQIEIIPVGDNPASISPVGNRLWDAIDAAVTELEGPRRLIPTMATVATDARFWRAEGTVAYGVGLFDDRMTFGEMLALFHGHDERVSVASVEKTAQLYERVLSLFLAPG
jgi:acetylornithine deacetylase/succinyl-diaminopimelate desuccinylase-like protein